MKRSYGLVFKVYSHPIIQFWKSDMTKTIKNNFTAYWLIIIFIKDLTNISKEERKLGEVSVPMSHVVDSCLLQKSISKNACLTTVIPQHSSVVFHVLNVLYNATNTNGENRSASCLQYASAFSDHPSLRATFHASLRGIPATDYGVVDNADNNSIDEQHETQPA